MERVAEQLNLVAAAVERAALGCGRPAGSVTLVAVSKRQPAAAIRAAYAAGHRDFGESYVQEWRDKAAELSDLAELRWHFVGHLQRNKMRAVAGALHLIHGLDDGAGVAEMARRASESGGRQDVLLQVSLAGEQSKRGCPPHEVAELARRIMASPGLRLRGLMTMPPFDLDPERSRPLFSQLRRLLEGLRAEAGARVEGLDVLSMGMSDDFRVAIEEGATHVRVGTAIFGDRAAP